ncbi:hypothetical protein [Flavobacterium tyrosinilyticum]|uniref:hypothetical protein n=1 Tax=Flavobacterium tyrosinilyticum TaxID=1658740 RepID=UPI00202EE5AC|nr:hypothetical protein [Flavobacterium tyrosinilyticum]MCM0667817.1 hypothetical protein [Flavobacterium tyrosinilyticum]
MDWKKFTIEKIKTPNEIIGETLEGFNEATNNLLNLSLFEKSEIELLRQKNGSSFQYDLVLHTKYMRSYKFVVFELFFDVTLYPCALKIEKGIAKNLDLTQNYIISENESQLRTSLELIFNTEKFNEIVSGLMKLSSLSKEEDDKIPF